MCMKVCPCGYYGDVRRACICTGAQIHRYRSRISGPLLDRKTFRSRCRLSPSESFPWKRMKRHPKRCGSGSLQREISRMCASRGSLFMPMRICLHAPSRSTVPSAIQRSSYSKGQSRNSGFPPGPIIVSSRSREPSRILKEERASKNPMWQKPFNTVCWTNE